MNSPKTQLPAFLIADLYKSNLVLVTGVPTPITEKAVAEKPAAKTVKPTKQAEAKEWFLGSNQKNITLVVNETGARYLKDDSLQFLSSILSACKLNLGDVAIVNYHQDPVDYLLVKEKLAPRFLLLFDVTAKQVQLPFTIPFYQVQDYDKCQILLVPSLEKMLGVSQEAKLEKSRLWLSLQKMFQV